MPSTVPTPVAAALGIVPTVFDGVRRLPGKAISLPIYAVSSALTSIDRARRDYDALAQRGERLIARLRGTSFDEVEDRVEDALQGTPLAAPYDRLEDALEDATENVTALVRSAPTRARQAAGSAAASTGSALDRAADTVEDLASDVADTAGSAAETVADTAGSAAETVADTAGSAAETVAETAEKAAETVADSADEVPDAEAPKGVPTPKATEPDSTRVDTAAAADVVEAVERVSATIGGEVLSHDELPLPDYDHMTLGSLRGRMRSLDVPQLVQVRDYEKAHADRLPIVTMLDNRIAKLAGDPTAPLSGSAPTDPVPAKSTGSRQGSKVAPDTAGPAQNPPSQGDPTNPAQPR